jgi:LmbE family N-acetylglucosaminyl deacetylase
MVAGVVAACLFLLAGSYLASSYTFGREPSLASYDTFATLGPNDRVTVVSPHTDDETIGIGGLIASLRRQDVQVSVIFMTCGDDNPIGTDLQNGVGYPAPDQLVASGIQRQHEAIAALHELGVEQSAITFLGLPDRGLKEIASAGHATVAYRSPGTLKESSPYPDSFQPDLPYTGNAARDALSRAIIRTRPTFLLTTPLVDTHTDHSATAQMVLDVLPRLSFHPSLFYFLVHYPGYPRGRGGDTVSLLPPKRLASLPWQVVDLQPADITAKRAATSRYVSQLPVPFLGRLMYGMIRKNELLLPQR